MSTRAIQRIKDETGLLRLALDRLEQSDSSIARLNKTVVKALIESNERILRCTETKAPFIASYYAYGPEIYTAMDLPWYSVAAPITTPIAVMGQQALECRSLDIPTELCTAIRLSLYYIENDMCLPPSASIAMITPCDGMQIMNQILAAKDDWRDVPMFAPDPPYVEGERASIITPNNSGRWWHSLKNILGVGWTSIDFGRLSRSLTGNTCSGRSTTS